MKKILFLTVFILFFIYARADLLRDFSVAVGGASSITAGTAVPVTITAYDITGAVKTDYTGNLTITASIGEIIVQETSSQATGSFGPGTGRWTGFMEIRGAASPVNILFTDISGATGTASKTVTPGAYSKLKLITDDMVFAPGTISGHTGTWVTLTTTSPFYVTVHACDDWYNEITSGFPRVRVRSNASDEAVTPTPFAVMSGASQLFAMTILPNPDQSAYYTITAEDYDNTIINDFQNIWFASLSEYYMWAEVPLSMIAGEHITVTVKVSHFDGGSPINGFNEIIEIKAADSFGNTNNAEPLLPVAAPVAACSDGVAHFVVSYTKSGDDIIRIRPRNTGGTVMTGTQISGLIDVYAAAPASFDFSADKNKLNKNETALLSATVYDTYANPVSDTAVNFTITTGDGQLNTQSAFTDKYGLAQAIFTAPPANRENIIEASVPVLASAKNVTITSALSSKFENWPNPFNPEKEKTEIHYFLAEDSSIEFKLYSMFGRLVWSTDVEKGEIKNGEKHGVSGGNTITWDGTTNNGFKAGAGLYVLKMKVTGPSGSYVKTRKIAVMK